jgi:hypothetical protein
MHLIDQGGDVPQLHEQRAERPGRAPPRSYSLEFKRRIVEEALAGRASVAVSAPCTACSASKASRSPELEPSGLSRHEMKSPAHMRESLDDPRRLE